MIDYKEYNLQKFRVITDEILTANFRGKMSYGETQAKVNQILKNETTRLTAKSFYDVILLLNQRVDNVCRRFFQGHPAKKLDSLKQSPNKLQNLVNPLLNSRALLSKASGIKETRLGELFQKKFDEIYASEVYGLAIALNLKPSQLFDYFYGDGERPVVSV